MNKFLYINSKIGRRLIKIAENIVSFEMTEREWKSYSEKHPGAKKENHHIIHVPGKSFRSSDLPEYLKREANAKMKYFQKIKQKHPNYKPIISKENLMETLKNGEYSCISAGVNKEDPKDVQKARHNPNFIKERTTALMNDLDKLGVEYTEIVGDYDGEEPSFLISHNVASKITQKKKDNSLLIHRSTYSNKDNIIEKLNKLGKKYNQDSVAHGIKGKMEWHYTTGEKAGKRVKGKSTKFLTNPEAYFSEARVGEADFTAWSCNMDRAFEGDKYLTDNPYFK